MTLSYATIAQELSRKDIIQIREVQALLISNPEKALAAATRMTTSQNEIFRLCGKYYIANYHYNRSDYKTAKQILIELLDTLESKSRLTSNKSYVDLKGMCLNKLFYLHKNLGEYSQALYFLDKYNDGNPTDRFEEQYGIARIALGDYAEGIAMLKHAAATSPHLRLGEGESKTMNDKLFADKYNMIGEAYQKYYLQSKKPILLDSADYYFNKAARLMLDHDFETAYTTALLYMRQAGNAEMRGQYRKALALYRKGKHGNNIEQNIRTVQQFDLGMANCFYHLKQYDSAITYSHRYIKNYAITRISKENLLVIYNILSKSYNAKKDNKEAYRYARKSLMLIDSIDVIKNKSLGFVHNYDLKKITAESEEIINQKTYFKLGLFGVLFILTITALGFYYYYREQKSKQRRFLEIIRKLKEKPLLPDDITNDEKEVKYTLDDDFITKTAMGLRKLEEKEAFLKPNFRLDFVAKKLNTNTTYLSQYFNQVMDKTFSEYTQELRIGHVLQKLDESPVFRNYTMQAIAEEVGYKDAATFVRVFKKQTGLSPSYYIEQLRK
ncbi:helix-turn-helix domain-containing protein [Flavobacterium sp. AS60]|uniref:helix-turn-helix domain-containing protein n=1 Tax=Flavobacterium anseongense TaxID=2910677 RepID=UPI001F1EC9F1|nr:helix-turn-helix domain-containing protein [Flavobacterium sp. AS60]MCF6129309.1 helix-turn-helix domain-containing protein [Flavobacterium sp. AS60]